MGNGNRAMNAIPSRNRGYYAWTGHTS